MENRVYRGEIYYIHETEISGNEQAGGRPGIIISNDVGNEHSPVVIVVYLLKGMKRPELWKKSRKEVPGSDRKNMLFSTPRAKAPGVFFDYNISIASPTLMGLHPK